MCHIASKYIYFSSEYLFSKEVQYGILISIYAANSKTDVMWRLLILQVSSPHAQLCQTLKFSVLPTWRRVRWL